MKVIFSTLSSILGAAVDDERIAKNPCKAPSIRLPKLEERRIVPWTDEQVVALSRSLPDRYAVMLTLTTGLGLRRGEAFGLAVDDIDFMRQVVTIQRQVSIVGSRLVFALPKNRKVREIPLPDRVAQHISQHLRAYPALTVSLPWERPSGSPAAARLLLTSREGKALNRNYIARSVWRPAVAAAGMTADRVNGMHGGRHFYASVQLEAGTGIRALADYLGHSDPGFTLRTYTHLMPQAEDKARRAVDNVFERLETVVVDPLSGPDVAHEAR